MRTAHLALSIAAFALGGCNLMLKFFPHRPTDEEARAAIRQCRASPDEIAWHVTKDGMLALDTKTENGRPIPRSLTGCLMNWGKWHRVNIALMIRFAHHKT